MIKLRLLIMLSLLGLVKRYHGRILPNKIKLLYNGDPSKNKNYASAMCLMYLKVVKSYGPIKDVTNLILLFNRYNLILAKKQKYNIPIPNQVLLFSDPAEFVTFIRLALLTIQDKDLGSTVFLIFKN